MSTEYKQLRQDTIGTRGELGVDLDISSTSIDIIFVPVTVLALIYSIFLVYNWDKVYENDWAKLMVIITNAWGIFPLIVARGFVLKITILGAMITSFWAHMVWEDFKVPGDQDSPGKWDNMFSAMVIVAYCIEWLPDRWLPDTICCKKQDDRKSCAPFLKEIFLDRPQHTNACNFRLDWKTVIQTLVIAAVGIVIFYLYDTDDMYVTDEWTILDIICLAFIGLAIIWGIIYIAPNNHIYDGYKPNLIGWIVGGVLLGVWALISKKIGGSEDDAAHSAWHISIFSAAYCFSRAHSYLKILKD
tara:strand:+ start:3817 stop:4719 length:903 start_codon:yes stop_codon:yes gene_type:complete